VDVGETMGTLLLAILRLPLLPERSLDNSQETPVISRYIVIVFSKEAENHVVRS